MSFSEKGKIEEKKIGERISFTRLFIGHVIFDISMSNANENVK